MLTAVAGLVLSGCAIGNPKPVTYLSDTGATLNGDVSSSVDGPADYWFRYGPSTSYGSESPHRTIAIADRGEHPVSEPLAGLGPATPHHFQMCVADEQESPPRVVCSGDNAFTTKPPGGSSEIAFTTNRDGNNNIYVMDANGNHPTALTGNSASDSQPSWSPDGTRVAFTSNRDGNDEIYVIAPPNLDATRLTKNSVSDSEPVWSPDGQRIAFTRADPGSFPLGTSLYMMNADGTNQQALRPGTAGQLGFYEAAWSPDARQVAFGASGVGQPGCTVCQVLARIELQTGNGTVILSDSSIQLLPRPDWSPFGRRLAFDCIGGGLCLIDSDGSGLTGFGGGSDPSWAPGGDRLAYSSGGDIHVKAADGSSDFPITGGAATDAEPAWSHRP